MHNYYNILPSVLLDVLFIFFLEGVVFYKFLFPMEKNLAANQLSDFNMKLKQKMSSQIVQSNLDTESLQILQKDIDTITNSEKNFINDSSNYFIIVFSLFCLGILIIVIIYYYVCKYTFGIQVNWQIIFVSLFFIVICIIVFEIVYFLCILLKKQINDKKILQYFINDLLN